MTYALAPAAFALNIARNPVARAVILSTKRRNYRGNEDGTTEAILIPKQDVENVQRFLSSLGIIVEQFRLRGQAALRLIFEASRDYVHEVWNLLAKPPEAKKKRYNRGRNGIFKRRGLPTRH